MPTPLESAWLNEVRRDRLHHPSAEREPSLWNDPLAERAAALAEQQVLMGRQLAVRWLDTTETLLAQESVEHEHDPTYRPIACVALQEDTFNVGSGVRFRSYNPSRETTDAQASVPYPDVEMFLGDGSGMTVVDSYIDAMTPFASVWCLPVQQAMGQSLQKVNEAFPNGVRLVDMVVCRAVILGREVVQALEAEALHEVAAPTPLDLESLDGDRRVRL